MKTGGYGKGKHMDIFENLQSDDLDSVITAEPIERKPFADVTAAVAFLKAGKATATFESIKTGARFTFKVSAPKDPDAQAQADELRFVSVLTGPDNTSNYSYIGFIRRGVFFYGRKSKIGETAASVVAYKWAWSWLAKGTLPNGLAIWHEGRCGRCGRTLTVPESVASGFGPECIGKLGM
jgi:hypothetical protein